MVDAARLSFLKLRIPPAVADPGEGPRGPGYPMLFIDQTEALNRIRSKIDKHLRPNQNGFRPGHSTIAHILGLRLLIEGVKSHNLKAVLVFIDFKKAFDSVRRGRMLQILTFREN